MHAVYSAKNENGHHSLAFNGNKVFPAQENIAAQSFQKEILDRRLDEIVRDPYYFYLHRINTTIFFAAVEYFRNLGAEWVNLPLTTKMISSPGEVYAGKTLDYTTDTLPVELRWFDHEEIFLAESSQFYLELMLMMQGVEQVFSIYNSFRKEPADYSHLSEFQHIEYEGKVNFQQNVVIAVELLRALTRAVVEKESEALAYFLAPEALTSLKDSFSDQNIVTLTFREALQALYEDTKEDRYKELTLKHFGSWEEVRLTELMGKHIIVTEFPLLQIPFYHNMRHDKDGVPLAENADIILYGYRETIGSGVRITQPAALAQKAKQFNLPLDDYAPYLKMRDYESYKSTAGFGLGWQRYVQWLLQLPFIWQATHIPRGHHLPRP